MTDDFTILASTYLDGQATAAERAQVDGDAELLVEVERLRRVRSLLGDTSDGDHAAPISTRERHLAAALDAWDRLPASELGSDATPIGTDGAGTAGGASITAPIPLREQRAQRRPVSTRFLTAAAAVVVFAGAGLVVRSALDTSSGDESADFTSTELDSADDTNRALNELAADEFAADGEGETADAIAEEAAPAPAVEAAASESGGPEQAPVEAEVETLSSNADLADYANLLIISRQNQTNPTSGAESGDEPQGDVAASDSDDASQVPAQTTPPTLPAPVDLCDLIDDFVGFAFWEASGLFDEPIAVGIDNSSNEAVAYQAETCTEVARTPLP